MSRNIRESAAAANTKATRMTAPKTLSMER
jgi:hypothetical protein